MGRGSLDVSTVPLWSPSRVAAARAAKRAPTIRPYFDVTPFAAVCFVLLFMFMCIAPPYHHGAPALPRAQNATRQGRAIREDAIHINVARDGKVFLGSREASPEELAAIIRDAVGHGSERKIYLTVDRRAHYGDVKPVINAIQSSGITRVAILADEAK
jgi:biopolymer transport protein TolR